MGPSAAYIDLFAASPLARSVSLRRGFVPGRLALIALSLLGALILAGGALFTGSIDLLGAGLFLVATALSAWQIALFWLVDQLSLPVRKVTLVVLGVVLGVVLVSTAIPATSGIASWLWPWGWVSHVWQSVNGRIELSTWVALGALLLGISATRWTTTLLGFLSHEDLHLQAQRWGTIVTLVTSGDVKSAMNRSKTVPRTGRHWHVSGVLLHVIMEPTLSAGDVVPWTVTLVAFLVIVPAFSAYWPCPGEWTRVKRRVELPRSLTSIAVRSRRG